MSKKRTMTSGNSSSELVKLIQDADRVVMDPHADVIIMISDIKPCDVQAVTGAVHFKYDPKKHNENCTNSDLAQIYVHQYKNKHYGKKKLTVQDYNNVCCAYIWQVRPDWKKAGDVLKLAVIPKDTAKEDRDTIEKNTRIVDQAAPIEVPEPPVTVSEVRLLRQHVAKEIDLLEAKEISELRKLWE